MLFTRIKNAVVSRFFYAGIGKERFTKEYLQIGDKLRIDNIKNLSIFSLFGSLIFAAIFILSFVSGTIAENRMLYLAMLCISVAVFVSSLFIKKRSVPVVRTLVYTYVLAVLIFSAVLGTVYSKSELSVTFMVVIIASPLVFVDRPMYFSSLVLFGSAVFVGLAFAYKDENCLTTDVLNAAVFTVFSLTACTFTMNIKLQKFFLEEESRASNEIDILTELRNRNCFENDISDYPTSSLRETYFVYMDANGLHEMNNQRGHTAGDNMLRKTATEFKKQFGDRTYRVGGDEFVAFGKLTTVEELKTKIEELKKAVENEGYSISVGFDIGTDVKNIDELIKLAEHRMYTAKAKHYSQAGMDRRRH